MGKRDCGDKLSNSGNILKLLVPSHIWKYMSGWSNFSGMVISKKINESKMDNRGSKSSVLNNILVKEQWVNGSWLVRFIFTNLRCILRGFERNRDIYHSLSHNMCLSSRVKIPSKQFCLYPYRPLQNYASLSTLALGGKKK